MKTNLITFPDKIYSSGLNILVINPNADLKKELQEKLMGIVECNLYVYENDRTTFTELDWILSVFHLSNFCILNIDQMSTETRQLASYFIGYHKTYWLTNDVQPIYTNISSNRIYNLEFLDAVGGNFASK